MDPKYLVAIDIGSSYVKSSVYTTAGEVLGSAKRDVHPDQPRPGVAEYDAKAILRDVLDALHELVEKTAFPPGEVAAISLDGICSGTMGIDAQGDPIMPYTTTLDMRFAPYLNRALDEHHDLIRSLTGSGQPTTGPKIQWVRDTFPDIYRRSLKFVTIGGYVLGQLIGLPTEDLFMDHTYLWATGLSDTQHYAWSPELCALMDIPLDKLPRIVKSTEVVGGLSQPAADITGLRAGTPIVAGSADQTAALVGAGITQPNRMSDNAGTYPVVAWCTETYQPDLKNRMAEILPAVVPGCWNPVSYIIGGGLTHHWFQETFASADEVAAQAAGAGNVYAYLDDQARTLPPGSEKLFFIPHLGGRACPNNTDYRGAWFGFTWTHRRPHFYRAVLESIAYDEALMFRSFKENHPEADIKEVLAYGGGSRSALWTQIKADVMGLPYECLCRDDMSAAGIAILAGYAMGIFDDITAASERFIQDTIHYEPRADAHHTYSEYVDFYRDLLQHAEPAFAELTALSGA
jgi:xylulokinase